MTTNTIIDVPGFKVGHATNLEAATGCSVVICPSGTVGGVDVRGGAPGTRETDLLAPHNHVEEVSAVMLSGGSAYGLASADGVMRYLSEHDMGYRSGTGFLVPIVPAAILFDLGMGDSTVRPDREMGYAACEAASDSALEQGTVGAGTGALIGAMRGKAFATKGGIGSASIDLGAGLVVGALVAVNAVGDVLDEDGNVLAGVRGDDGQFLGMMNLLKGMAQQMRPASDARENTVIGVVATNAKLTKAQAKRMAIAAHDGIAQSVRPSHTDFDGDTIFSLASGEIEANPFVISAFAAEAVAQAIRNGIRNATSLDSVRAWNE